MPAMLYLPKQNDPIAILDDVQIVKMNDNHAAFPYRITYQSSRLNAGKKMVEMHRDQKLLLKLDDGRTCSVVLQHASMDSTGKAVGVLRVLDGLAD